MTAPLVPALLRERDGYRQARRWDRMRQVDAVLATYGVVVDDGPEAAVEVPVERAVRPRGRSR